MDNVDLQLQAMVLDEELYRQRRLRKKRLSIDSSTLDKVKRVLDFSDFDSRAQENPSLNSHCYDRNHNLGDLEMDALPASPPPEPVVRQTSLKEFMKTKRLPSADMKKSQPNFVNLSEGSKAVN